MTRAFIIGNGKSRSNFDLNLLKEYGTIFGCNALYRDFDPDYLVAIDSKMKQEIVDSNYNRDKVIFPIDDECWEPAEYNKSRPRSNAGMNAILEAIKKGHTEIVCLGFDFLLHDNMASISNIYDGTSSYEENVRCSLSDSRNRMGYLGYVIEKNTDINFTFVYNSTDIVYKPALNNFSLVHYNNLINNLKR